MVEKTWNGRIRTRITMWKFKWDNSTRTLSLKKRKWQEVKWMVMIGAQNDDNTRNMPQSPHFHFGIYPCLHQTFIWCRQGLNTPAETVLPWSPGLWRSPGLTLEASCCFSPQLCSLFQLWNHIWFANLIACLIKKKTHVDFERGLITLCCAQVMGKVVKTIER